MLYRTLCNDIQSIYFQSLVGNRNIVIHLFLSKLQSQQIPLKITVTKDNKTLVAQATGQPAFPLEATEKDKFKFDQAGVA